MNIERNNDQSLCYSCSTFYIATLLYNACVLSHNSGDTSLDTADIELFVAGRQQVQKIVLGFPGFPMLEGKGDTYPSFTQMCSHLGLLVLYAGSLPKTWSFAETMT